MAIALSMGIILTFNNKISITMKCNIKNDTQYFNHDRSCTTAHESKKFNVVKTIFEEG